MNEAIVWFGRKLDDRNRAVFAAAIVLVLLAAGACGSPRPLGGESASADASKAAPPPQVDTIKVVARRLNITTPLPGEIVPYQVVGIFPKVTGFVKTMNVDRGSRVRTGQLLAVLEAPELVAQKAEEEAKFESAQSRVDEAQAKLTADEANYQRLLVAAKTPGVISDDELETAQKNAEADRARVKSLQNSVEAENATLRSVEQMESYLRVTAPFDGIITERNVHPGALVGPSSGPDQKPILRLEQTEHLRLVVAVPEAYVAGVQEGKKVTFTVPSFPGRVFAGTIARIAHSLAPKTRTMPVELDVANQDQTLAPGMFPTVLFPVERPDMTLFVPDSAVARTMEADFVICVRDGKANRVSVKTGASDGGLVEVFGDLHAGDDVVLRASEDLLPGTAVTPRPVSSPD
jgi:membrane fusion protein, multidrug efflux system